MGRFKHSRGCAEPLGLARKEPGSWNFAVYSSQAKKVALGLFAGDTPELIPLHQTGHVWHAEVADLPEGLEYAYQCDGGPWLLDPHARLLSPRAAWDSPIQPPLRGVVGLPTPFDWQGVEAPRRVKEELIIYELHVRGLTQHPSSGVSAPGTYLGVVEKIPYLLELGVNAVELMPVFEFEERHVAKPPNYWGYNPLSWFAPKQAFGSIDDFRTMVRELHRNGIEVILDVVYNHTAESTTPLSWRGLDAKVYYMPSDYTGCGNTVNANHPVTQELIVESLRYWVEEMRVDGFRFDLASVFTRAQDGSVLNTPPILQAMAADPTFANTKLIAEAWDAAGLYQLNFFPRFGPWSEWNGAYRDIVRRFIKGTSGKAGRFANAMTGSDVIYASTKTPTSSINFLTAHDGFTLRDLVTYEAKHNDANGEMNRDGANQNDSWHCGIEGPTDRPDVLRLRERQMRNFWLALILAQGIPMILMGDEYGHTRGGNNNPYVQDNELNWFLWDELEKNRAIWKFVRAAIAFRKAHPELRQNRFLTSHDITWHGVHPGSANWSADSRLVAWSTKGNVKPLYTAFNAGFQPVDLQLPEGAWRVVVYTDDGWDKHFFEGDGPAVEGGVFRMEPYSAVVLSK